MTDPALSILVVADVEKGPEFLERYLGGLREWNADGLDAAQVVVISQHEDPAGVRAACAAQPFPVEVVEAVHPRVNGYPVWDILEELRQAWPLVRGRYVTTHHTEFLWCPGRLRKTIDHLEQRKPYLALGNLRRPWKQGGNPRGSEEISNQLTGLLDKGDWQEGRRVAETIPTWHWIYWVQTPPPSGPSKWLEEVFFADREWLEVVQFAHHGGRLPFQDVYDVMGRAISWLERSKLSPAIERMPLETHKAIHLWHTLRWETFTEAMRDYFLGNRAEWAETTFGNKVLWRQLIALQRDRVDHSAKAVVDLRLGSGGTVTRYGAALQEWLGNGGTPALRQFYAAHGQERREQ